MTPETGTMTGPEAAEVRVLGVELGDGETVLFTTRQHWSVPVLSGLVPSAGLGLFLSLLVTQRPTSLPPRILGTLVVLALVPLMASAMRFALRRYVLTDLRVIVRDGRGFTQIPLSAVRRVETDAGPQPERPGDVRFESDQGVMMWTRVPRAARVAEIANEAVRLYGRG